MKKSNTTENRETQENINFLVDPKFKRELEDRARVEERSLGGFIRNILKDYLQHVRNSGKGTSKKKR